MVGVGGRGGVNGLDWLWGQRGGGEAQEREGCVSVGLGVYSSCSTSSEG